MRSLPTALALVVGLAGAGCNAGPTPVIASGPWGGTGISMQVTSSGARLEYDCAEGAIGEPLRPDREGRFTAGGTHTPGRGGPIRLGEILPSFPARYEGEVERDAMRLTVTVIDTGGVVGSFELRRGSQGLLRRCL